MSNRITHATIGQHGNPNHFDGPIESLKAVKGRLNDVSLSNITCAVGDFFALHVDTTPVPFAMIDVQTAGWEYFYSFDPVNPTPINPAGVQKNGAYVGLYTFPNHNTTGTYYSSTGRPVYFIARATTAEHNGVCHIVANGFID